MSSSFNRGKTLDPFAVDKAIQWRLRKIEELEANTGRNKDVMLLSPKERHLLSRLQATKEATE